MAFTSHLVRVKNQLKRSLNQAQRDKLAKFQALRFRSLQHLCFRLFVGSNLKTLAILNKSDKWGSHWYAQHYERHFAALRHKRLNILEIGVIDQRANVNFGLCCRCGRGRYRRAGTARKACPLAIPASRMQRRSAGPKCRAVREGS